MILKLLGIIDLLVALMLFLLSYGFPVTRIYFFVMILHAVKAVVFIRDIFSLLDFAIVLYTLILPFWSNDLLTIICIIFLLYKGSYSLI